MGNFSERVPFPFEETISHKQTREQGEALSPQLQAAINVIDTWLAFKQFDSKTPAISVGIVTDEGIVFSNGYGYEDITTRSKAKDTTGYRIASISKTFTATAVMQLVEQEKLHLDDKVNQHLRWFRSDDTRMDEITVRQLLTHSSGIERDGKTEHWMKDEWPNTDQIIEQVQQGISIFEPNERFKYSNFGYALLGEVIQAVSGKPYNEYVTDAIIKPLGMTNTYPDATLEAQEGIATGYGIDIPGRERETFSLYETDSMAAATGFISSAVDLCKYMSAQFIGSGKLLTDASKREMQRIQWKREGEAIDYGLGLMFSGEPKKKGIMGHGGGFPGYITQIAMDRDQKIGVVVLTNSVEAPTRNLVDGIFHTLNHFQKETSDEQNPHLQQYEGLFLGRTGFLQTLAPGKNMLLFSPKKDKPMDDMLELKETGTGEFTIVKGNDFDYIGEKITFEADKDGKITTLFLGPNHYDFIPNPPDAFPTS